MLVAERVLASLWGRGAASGFESCLPFRLRELENSRTIDRGRINMSINNTDRWQVLFQPATLFAGIMQENARSFWTRQTDILNEMQAFSEGWFERRQAGTRAALEAFECMYAAKMPTEWLSAYQKWLIGTVERLMADGLACENEMRKLSEVIAPSLVPSTDQGQRDTIRRATEKRARTHVG